MRGVCVWKPRLGGEQKSWMEHRSQLDRRSHALGSFAPRLFLAMWWISHVAAACIHNGQRQRFDRGDRRNKSTFRLGRLWLLDILRRAHNPASVRWCLPFHKTKTGWRFALRF